MSVGTDEAAVARPTHDELTATLVESGHLLVGDRPGLRALGGRLEEVVEGLTRAVRALGDAPGARRVACAPVTHRSVTERSGYVANFPQLVGAVRVFRGGDREHRELVAAAGSGADWSARLDASDLTLVSAACHPLYGVLSGTRLERPGRYDLVGQCFRHEPSPDPARLTSFRMHEQVYVGDAVGGQEHRDRWTGLMAELLTDLGLSVRTVAAHDPFFGRPGRLLASGQQAAELKLEVVAPVSTDPALGEDTPWVALASGNLHRDHFGEAFALRLGDEVAHSSCVGLGLERTALALVVRHGADMDGWPATVRRRLER